MEIKETSIFTKQIEELMEDDDYSLVQSALVTNPDLGDIIKGSGGIRKARWHLANKGKRGGVRFIYYWITEKDQIYMLLVYAKARQEDLTPRQLKVLKDLVKEDLNG